MRDAYQPFKIGKRFLIVPPNTPVSDKNRIQLVMDRGAFGSGEHETTQTCIEILEDLTLKKNPKILDIGSGTAILTIAASLLDPTGKAWCVDIDTDAVESGRRNCRLNNLNSSINHQCGTLDQLEETGFDLILANIYGDILLDIAVELASKANSGGWLILSGILWEYNFDVRQKFQQAGCEVIKNRLMTEFSTVLLKKL
jgi:ribosomal protein L11 methyltransferase